MTSPFTGGCACGALRYEIAAEPVAMVQCHCRQCQRDSGTGHQSHLTFVDAPVKATGTAATWDSVGDGGTRKRRGFCPTCGSPVHLTFPDMPEVFIVAAASLDDPERFRPGVTTWASAAPSWDHVDRNEAWFERMPTG
jgi:hypothetical protein